MNNQMRPTSTQHSRVETRMLLIEEMAEASRIHRAAFRQAMPMVPDLHTPEEDAGYWAHLYNSGKRIFGTLVGARLAGVIAYGDGWIDQLYVLPDFQGRGLGRSLLSQAKADMSEIRLWTFQSNERARLFYERHGFTAIDQTDGSSTEEKQPDILYRWSAR